MSDVMDAWNTLIKIQAEQSLSNAKVHKIEELLSSDDIADIRNGMTVLTTLSSAHLCRYLKLVDHGVDQSILLNTRPDWSNVSNNSNRYDGEYQRTVRSERRTGGVVDHTE